MEKRNTIQRELVLSAVNSLANHPTADEVYNYVSARHQSVSKGTVYRNLNALSEQGILRRVPVPGAADRYDHNAHEHYHLLCTQCGSFTDAPQIYLGAIDDAMQCKTGYAQVHHEIMFSGICTACANT